MSKIKQNKIPVKLAKRIRLTKVNDDAFEGNHPNGIDEGYVVEGHLIESPKIGSRFYVACAEGFSTSNVTELPNEEGIFKTMYSTYKLEYLE